MMMLINKQNELQVKTIINDNDEDVYNVDLISLYIVVDEWNSVASIHIYCCQVLFNKHENWKNQ